jgi:thiol-disulfide isomerase/thioredoxin
MNIIYMQKLVTLFIASLLSIATWAQPAEVTKDGSGNKVIRGFMTQKELTTDSSFQWYAANLKGYTPLEGTVQAFKNAKDSIHILAFGGTWCDDTKHILPKFFATTDAAGFSADHITLLGVDLNKKTINHLSEAFNVTRVPTFIVLKNGKEIGRVVEYGKIGMPEKEVGEIIAGKR